MSTYEADDSPRKDVLLLIEVASLFTRGNLTGAQGLAILEGTEVLLRESKKENSAGGMVGALATMYADKELPVPLMEGVILAAMTVNATFFRENLSNQIERAVKFVQREEVNLEQPWRAMLGDLFTVVSTRKAESKKALRQIRFKDQDEEVAEA